MNDKEIVGTNIGFGIRPEVMSIMRKTLRSSRSGLAAEISRGRANGVFMVAAWMLYLVSPEISGNYYVFAYAGDFPRMEEGEAYSRKVLRNRIKWAGRRAIDCLHPEFIFQVEDVSLNESLKMTVPANATKHPRLRPWDIPIIAHGNQVLIPVNWTEFAQVHREEMYRLDSNFARAQLPSLLIQGRIMREVLRGHDEFEKHLGTPSEIWGRLKEVLDKQHVMTRWQYKDSLESTDKFMASTLAEEAKVAFLAFSIVDFRPKYDLQKPLLEAGTCHGSNHERKRKRQEMRKFT